MGDNHKVDTFENIIQMFSNTGAWNIGILFSVIKINCKLNSSPGTFTRQVYFYYNFQFRPHTWEWGDGTFSQQSQGLVSHILPRCGGTSVHAWTGGREPTQPHQ